MSEQELVQALRELVARHAPLPDSGQFSAEIINRDRGRVRWLAGLTMFLWVAGTIVLLYTIFWFNRFIIFFDPLQMVSPSVGANSAANQQLLRGLAFHAKMELHHSLEACMFAVPVLLLAALRTIWLVLSSRRATLNQINISLSEISEQLKEMRQAARAQIPARP